MKKALLALTLFAACSNPSKADTPPMVQPPKAEPPPRHLGMEYAKKYLTEKFKVFENPDCQLWEDEGFGKTQSVICSLGENLGLYCVAGNGRAPGCDVLVDKRPKSETEKKGKSK